MLEHGESGIGDRLDLLHGIVGGRVVDEPYATADLRLSQNASDRCNNVSRAVVAPNEDVDVVHPAGRLTRHRPVKSRYRESTAPVGPNAICLPLCSQSARSQKAFTKSRLCVASNTAWRKLRDSRKNASHFSWKRLSPALKASSIRSTS